MQVSNQDEEHAGTEDAERRSAVLAATRLFDRTGYLPSFNLWPTIARTDADAPSRKRLQELFATWDAFLDAVRDELASR